MRILITQKCLRNIQRFLKGCKDDNFKLKCFDFFHIFA